MLVISNSNSFTTDSPVGRKVTHLAWIFRAQSPGMVCGWPGL